MVKLDFSPVQPADWQSADLSGPLPLQQYWAYATATEALGATPYQLTFYDNEGQKIAIAIAMQRRFAGFVRFHTLFRGPVWLGDHGDAGDYQTFLQAIRQHYQKRKWRFMALLPEFSQEDRCATLLADAGFRRVMTGFSTAWLDLSESEADLRRRLKGKWRNQLKKAEDSKIDIALGGRKPHQYSWLLEREHHQRDSRRYQATPLGLVPPYVAAAPRPQDHVLSVSAIMAREKIAGALFLLHGHSATYHIGWAGEAGRKSNAQNLVLWRAMLALKEMGIRYLDLGGLNTAELAGIARFKLGTGAEPIIMAGAYL